MRNVILLVMVLLPCMAFAATACHIIEYPDHDEAVCVGDTLQPPASARIAEQEQSIASALTTDALASAQTPESALPDVPPENIVRNGLASLHGASWLNSRSR